MKEKDRTCPRTRFKKDLLAQLRKWIEQGDRLIVCMDVNEDIYARALERSHYVGGSSNDRSCR